MVESVSSYELGVGEHLRIERSRFAPVGMGSPEVDEAVRSGRLPRVCLVTGIHGDELEGQYLCYEVARRINARPDLLRGVVDIYPALNPLGVGGISRGIPHFDLDMNRIFPGGSDASFYESVAADIVADIKGATLAMDIHASNIYLRELPQIRINEITADRLVPLAMEANVDFVWVHANATVLKGTFAYSLNALDTPTLVVEMGVGMRVTQDYGNQLADGVFNLLVKLGAWAGAAPEVRMPIVSTDGEVSFLNAEAAGLFMPATEHDARVKRGQLVGRILDVARGTTLQELHSPVDGLLFTLREYPVVYPGSLIARILDLKMGPATSVGIPERLDLKMEPATAADIPGRPAVASEGREV